MTHPISNETLRSIRSLARGDNDWRVSALLTEVDRLQRENVKLGTRLELIRTKYSKLSAALFAVRFFLDKPYPDDARWTPWSRFVGPAAQMVQAALDGEDIGELEGMHRVTKGKHK